jgi:hypothetical protein
MLAVVQADRPFDCLDDLKQRDLARLACQDISAMLAAQGRYDAGFGKGCEDFHQVLPGQFPIRADGRQSHRPFAELPSEHQYAANGEFCGWGNLHYFLTLLNAGAIPEAAGSLCDGAAEFNCPDRL